MKQELAIGAILATCFVALNLTVAVFQELITAPPYSISIVASIEGFAIGAMFAQVVIVAIWSGLSPNKTLLRTMLGAAVLVLAAVGTSAFVNTFTPQVIHVRQSWGAESYTWLILVFIYALVQILMMLHRRWRGYWLSLGNSDGNQFRNRAFSLAELFIFPTLCCIPLIILPALLESLSPTVTVLTVFGLLIACVSYATLHSIAFLRNRVSIVWLSVLLLFCPLVLLPASLYLTGSVNGSIFGVPFVAILFFVHLGALAIGIPTATLARRIGYRIRSAELAT